MASNVFLGNSETLWSHAVACTSGNSMAHNNLGLALVDQGRGDEAVAHYQKALEIKPDDVLAHHNLGNALADRGQAAEALAHYQAVLRIIPDDVEAHFTIAKALEQQEIDEAIAHYRKALQIAPDYAGAHNNLAWLRATSPRASVRNGPKRSCTPKRQTNSMVANQNCSIRWPRPTPKRGGSPKPWQPPARPWNWPSNKTSGRCSKSCEPTSDYTKPESPIASRDCPRPRLVESPPPTKGGRATLAPRRKRPAGVTRPAPCRPTGHCLFQRFGNRGLLLLLLPPGVGHQPDQARSQQRQRRRLGTTVGTSVMRTLSMAVCEPKSMNRPSVSP